MKTLCEHLRSQRLCVGKDLERGCFTARLDRSLPLLSPVEVQAILQFTADDMHYVRTYTREGVQFTETADEDSWDEYTGYGLVNAKNAVELAVQPRFTVRDRNGKHMMSFDVNGNLCVEGWLGQNLSSWVLEVLIWLNEIVNGLAGFKICDGNGTPVLYIGEMSAYYLGEPRNLYGATLAITGEVHENQPDPLRPSSEAPDLIIKIPDGEGTTVAYVTSAGDIYLKGRLFEGANPDRRYPL